MRIAALTTAVIVVDMWDKHWCETYTAWADDMAKRLARALPRYREAGIPIIWMTADVYDVYKEESGALELLQYVLAPKELPPMSVAQPPPGLPVEGCACKGVSCVANQVWSKIHPDAGRQALDLIGSWDEHYGFLRRNEIKTLLYTGGATNVCVLNTRAFSICQAKALGWKTILLGDLTTPILPGRSLQESLDLVRAYYNEHICPVREDEDIILEGYGIRLDKDSVT